MKYGDISLVLCISTRLRLVTILSLLVKYLVILHADPCNKSYIFESKVRIFSEAEGRGKYSLQRVQYMPIFNKEGF